VLRSLFFVTLVWVIKVTFATKANKVHRSRISDFRSQISDLRSQKAVYERFRSTDRVM